LGNVALRGHTNVVPNTEKNPSKNGISKLDTGHKGKALRSRGTEKNQKSRRP